MIPITLVDAGRDRRLPRTALRILLLLHRECTYHEFRPVKSSWLAFVLQTDQGEVSRSLKRLRELGYVRRGAFDQTLGSHTYQLDTPRSSPVVASDATPRAA